MKNKIIFYSISFLLALCIKPVVGFMNEARDCKFELENFKQVEINNKKVITNQKIYAKKLKKNLSDGDIAYRLKLLEQINPSE
jgi:hypothetical protein